MSGVLASTRRRLLGLLLVVLIFAFFAITIGFYEKAFTPVVTVTLQTGTIGSQMEEQADVKVHGTVVGEVRKIEPDFTGATLTLAIQPQYAPQIPAATKAMLLPKSLFGDRFVSLDYPPAHSGPTLADGDHISEDNSSHAIEVEQAINNLLPVLQAVQPEKLNSTLTAVATAIQGKGPQIGSTIAQLNTYVHGLNPQIPDLTKDLNTLAKVSKTYSDVLPDLTGALDNLTTTSKTIADQAGNLNQLYSTLTGTSQNLQNFLSVNQPNLIMLGGSLKPTLNLLKKYSPEYPCFFTGLAKLVPLADKAFGKGTDKPGLHATIQIVVPRGPYKVGQDTPQYADKRGPRCYNITPQPNPFPQEPPEGAIKDGSQQPPEPRSQNNGLLPAGQAPGVLTTPQSASTPANPANSRAEQQLIATLAGPAMNRKVPNWAPLLLGPLMRGAEVTVQ